MSGTLTPDLLPLQILKSKKFPIPISILSHHICRPPHLPPELHLQPSLATRNPNPCAINTDQSPPYATYKHTDTALTLYLHTQTWKTHRIFTTVERKQHHLPHPRLCLCPRFRIQKVFGSTCKALLNFILCISFSLFI